MIKEPISKKKNSIVGVAYFSYFCNQIAWYLVKMVPYHFLYQENLNLLSFPGEQQFSNRKTRLQFVWQRELIERGEIIDNQ